MEHHDCVKKEHFKELFNRVGKLESRTDVQEERIENQKQMIKGIQDLTAQVSKMATSMGHMETKVDVMANQIKDIEKEPAEAYKHYKRVLAAALITGVASFILGVMLK